MAAFDLDALTQHPPDFRLIANGGAAMYLRDSVLQEAEQALQDIGYALVSVDARGWSDEAALHQSLAGALRFPAYYGHNLDALNDCLGDVAHGDYGWDPTATTGLGVVVRGFGGFARGQPSLARSLVTAFTGTTQEAMLFGHRVLWLLQVDDPDCRLDLARPSHVPWNGREGLDAKHR